MKKDRYVYCDNNGNEIFSLTEKQLHNEMRKQNKKLIECCCAYNNYALKNNVPLCSVKDIAIEVINENNGTLKERAILQLMLDNNIIPDHHYCYAEDKNDNKQ